MNLKSLLLNGNPKKPVNIADIEAAIAESETARAAQAELLQVLAARRETALIESDDRTIDKIEAEQAGAARELDRLDIALVRLRDRLAALLDAAADAEAERRRTVLAEIVQRRLAAAAAFDQAMADAAAAAEAFISTSRELAGYADLHGVAAEMSNRTWGAKAAARHAGLSLARMLEIPVNAMVIPAPMAETESQTWGRFA